MSVCCSDEGTQEDTAMQCQFCDNPATIHLTDIIQKKKRETHLCEECARKQKIIPDSKQELHIPALLQFLLGSPSLSDTKSEQSQAAEQCESCGTKYSQFKSEGRLGCPHDYDIFSRQLDSLLRRIHRSNRHCGKSPVTHTRSVTEALSLDALRLRLQEAVEKENYEEAARLRDLIRAQENS